MELIKGKNNTAKVFADVIDNKTKEQVKELCNAEWSKGSNIAIMPDCHFGAGCVIGTTMTIKDYVCPNVVGVDIGCGVLAKRVATFDSKKYNINLNVLDDILHIIPSGYGASGVWGKGVNDERIDYKRLRCAEALVKREHLQRSIGTIGSGNHFVEAGRDNEGYMWLTVHSGSRNLGMQVANLYQKLAEKQHPELGELAYLEGGLKDDYLNDMRYCQQFAEWNRVRILDIIRHTYNGVSNKGFYYDRQIESVHNYIDFTDMTLRKGAVKANLGDWLLVPLNMAEGTLICKGLGNKEYNNSAPHGAGRIMSRKQAKKNIELDDFKAEMKDVYSSCICEDTLDEAPQAYKQAKDIVPALEGTAKIVDKITPIYNFKATK